MNLLVSKNYKGWRVTFFLNLLLEKLGFYIVFYLMGYYTGHLIVFTDVRWCPQLLRKLKERPYLTAMDIFTSNFNLQKIQANTQLIQSKSF